MNPELQGTDQPASESALEDRIANVLTGPIGEEPEPGNGSDAPPPEEGEPAAEESSGDGLEEVEFSGKSYRVPPELKSAIMQHADYTQKTQGLAERSRNLELQAEQHRVAQLAQQFQQSIQGELQQVAMIDAQIQQLTGSWNQLTIEQKQDLMLLDRQRNELVSGLQGKQKEWTDKQNAEVTTLKSKVMDAVQKAIPGWSDTLAKEITEHAVSEGYTNAELQQVMDPRYIKTLWKAQQYDKLLKSKATALDKTRNAPPPAKVGSSNPMSQATKDKLKFQKMKAAAKTPQEREKVAQARIAQIFGVG